MERRLTSRGRQRRRQLMDVAATRFAERGYHPTSVAEIVRAIGVGKGVFYWYFSSKEALFLELLREAQQDLRRSQSAAIGDEPDPVRRIELGIRASLRWLEEHRPLFKLFEFAGTEDRFTPALRRGQEVAVADVVRHVKDGIVEGRIADGDPALLTHAVVGVINELARVLVHEESGGTDVADTAVAFCLQGLLGPRRPSGDAT